MIVIQHTTRNRTIDYPTWISPLLKDVETPVRITAICIGAGWAYFRFVKGRVLIPRLEVEIEGKAIKSDGLLLVVPKVKVKNVGLSVATIEHDETGLRILTLAESKPKSPVSSEWNHEGTFPIFEDHRSIEPSESISEEQLILTSNPEPAALRLELWLSDGKTLWRSVSILPTTKEVERNDRDRIEG